MIATIITLLFGFWAYMSAANDQWISFAVCIVVIVIAWISRWSSVVDARARVERNWYWSHTGKDRARLRHSWEAQARAEEEREQQKREERERRRNERAAERALRRVRKEGVPQTENVRSERFVSDTVKARTAPAQSEELHRRLEEYRQQSVAPPGKDQTVVCPTCGQTVQLDERKTGIMGGSQWKRYWCPVCKSFQITQI